MFSGTVPESHGNLQIRTYRVALEIALDNCLPFALWFSTRGYWKRMPLAYMNSVLVLLN